jgi:hypothetical protein
MYRHRHVLGHVEVHSMDYGLRTAFLVPLGFLIDSRQVMRLNLPLPKSGLHLGGGGLQCAVAP